jgi:hypothetical protein
VPGKENMAFLGRLFGGGRDVEEEARQDAIHQLERTFVEQRVSA